MKNKIFAYIFAQTYESKFQSIKLNIVAYLTLLT